MRQNFLSALACLTLAASPVLAHDNDRDKGGGRGNDGKDNDPPPMMVVDAAGKTLGRLGGANTGAFVAIKINGKLHAVDLAESRSEFEGRPKFDVLQFDTFKTVIYFHGINCTGDFYIPPRQSVGLPQTVTVRVGNFPPRPAWLYTFSGQSVRGPLYFSVFDNNGCRNVPGASGDDWLVGNGPPINISTIFKEPFHVE